jgi:WD40 repeat protein
VLSHGPELLYPAGRDLVVRNLESGRERKLATDMAFADVAYSAARRRLAVASKDGQVEVWNVTSGKREARRRLADGLTEAMISPDGQWIAVRTATGRPLLWNLAADAISSAGDDYLPAPGFLFFTADSRNLGYRGPDDGIRLRDLASGQLRVLRGHRARVTSVTPSPVGGLLASSDETGLLRLWDLRADRTAVLPADEGPLEAVAFSPDGGRLAVSGQSGSIVVWDLSSVIFHAAQSAGPPSWQLDTSAVIDDDGTLRTPP